MKKPRTMHSRQPTAKTHRTIPTQAVGMRECARSGQSVKANADRCQRRTALNCQLTQTCRQKPTHKANAGGQVFASLIIRQN
jgi:hypothetical protein